MLVPGDGAAAAVFAVGGGGCAAGVVGLVAVGEQCGESQQCGCAEEGEHDCEDAEQQQQAYADCEENGECLDWPVGVGGDEHCEGFYGDSRGECSAQQSGVEVVHGLSRLVGG